MIKANNLARVQQKRTIRPLYSWHSAVPYACFLDVAAIAAGSGAIIYPGMVATKTTGEQMDICNNGAATVDVPFGLFNNFIGGTMDELQGGTEISVWVGGRDGVFEVLAGFSATETPLLSTDSWVGANATRGGAPIYADPGTTTAGKLTIVSNGPKVARLIEAVSNSKVIIQLELATA